ncbi:hypothetical protein Bca52824_073517 [Brassica carinata]|uniref:RING-type domain-containing protein n=1 Tax=Brassica carinata TaxID=52824 RepID=A0A8X7QAR7_BRACI|nr:hypothetical protein Bca52824_073517 [Brassica carinata]
MLSLHTIEETKEVSDSISLGSQGRPCSSYGFWVGDGGIDEAAEEASAQKKSVSLQIQAAVTVEAAEDYARRFESGVNEELESGVNLMCKMCFLGESQGSERERRMLSCKICGKKYNKNCVKSWVQHIDLFHWSSWSCPSCRVCEIPNGLLQDCKSLQNLSLHNNPISMDEFRLVVVVTREQELMLCRGDVSNSSPSRLTRMLQSLTGIAKYWGSLKKVEETDEPRGRLK